MCENEDKFAVEVKDVPMLAFGTGHVAMVKGRISREDNYPAFLLYSLKDPYDFTKVLETGEAVIGLTFSDDLSVDVLIETLKVHKEILKAYLSEKGKDQ